MLTQAEIKKVMSLRMKKNRDLHKLFVVEGEKSVDELLQSNLYETIKVFVLKDLAAKYANSLVVSNKEMERLSQLKNHTSVLALVEIPNPIKELPKANGWWMLLDDVQDPGNVGTLIRIASWFGYEGVYCSNATADVFNSKVVQATMGSLFQLQVLRGDLVAFASHLNKNKVPIVVADMNGEDFNTSTVGKTGALLMGNEGHGPNKDIVQHAKHVVTIPRIGSAESLNVSVAAGILASKFH